MCTESDEFYFIFLTCLYIYLYTWVLHYIFSYKRFDIILYIKGEKNDRKNKEPVPFSTVTLRGERTIGFPSYRHRCRRVVVQCTHNIHADLILALINTRIK